jgi:quercetin dioxygenase-like cupin family protein
MASTGRVFITDLNDDSEYQKLLDGPPQTFGMRSGRVYLDPGQSCGQHSTDSNEEILIFLSGRGLLLIGESVSFRIGQ